MRIALALALILALAQPLLARSGFSNSRPQAALVTDGPDEIRLMDGSRLRGLIVAEDELTVLIETESLGRLEVPRAQIRTLLRAGLPEGGITDPDRNSILLTPTPQTIGRGEVYFRNFELLFLNVGYGLSDRLDLSLGTLFPIVGSWNFLAVGLKFELLDREAFPLGLALIGSHIMAPDDQRFSTFGAVLGLGDAHRSLNLAIDRGVDETGASGNRVMLGGDVQLTRKSKLFAEWADSGLIISDDDDDEFKGFLTVGFRLFGDSMAFTLGGVRPLRANTGDFLAFPLVMFSAHW